MGVDVSCISYPSLHKVLHDEMGGTYLVTYQTTKIYGWIFDPDNNICGAGWPAGLAINDNTVDVNVHNKLIIDDTDVDTDAGPHYNRQINHTAHETMKWKWNHSRRSLQVFLFSLHGRHNFQKHQKKVWPYLQEIKKKKIMQSLFITFLRTSVSPVPSPIFRFSLPSISIYTIMILTPLLMVLSA
jgi:hypothetical protein